MKTIMTKKPGGALVVAEEKLTLQRMQELVGGYIEVIRLPRNVMMFVNEEGALFKRKANFVTVQKGEIIHYVVGDVFFTGYDLDGEPVSLDKGQLDWLIKGFSHAVSYPRNDEETFETLYIDRNNTPK